MNYGPTSKPNMGVMESLYGEKVTQKRRLKNY